MKLVDSLIFALCRLSKNIHLIYHFFSGSKYFVNALTADLKSFASSSSNVLKISYTSDPAWYNNKACFLPSSLISAAIKYVLNLSSHRLYLALVLVGSLRGSNAGIGLIFSTPILVASSSPL